MRLGFQKNNGHLCTLQFPDKNTTLKLFRVVCYTTILFDEYISKTEAGFKFIA